MRVRIIIVFLIGCTLISGGEAIQLYIKLATSVPQNRLTPIVGKSALKVCYKCEGKNKETDCTEEKMDKDKDKYTCKISGDQDICVYGEPLRKVMSGHITNSLPCEQCT